MRKILFETNNNLEIEDTVIPYKKKTDKILLMLILTLLMCGTMMISSASFPYASVHYGDGAYYIRRQIIFLALGLFSMMIFSRIPVEQYRKFSP
ncbi:MAG: FtsW/RodA/SpoVE family cell cycle protein, partial [Clostridia bacterium]|nr:FtsW/RodA/SpoVE family cell cycle protein [Clostridia bacterium]